MIVLADKGLAGREMERYAAGQVKVLLARPDRKDERRRVGNLAGMRQWIEAIIGTLKPSSAWNDTADAHPPGLHPRRPAPARHGRLHLAQLVCQHDRPALADRLRPLNIRNN